MCSWCNTSSQSKHPRMHTDTNKAVKKQAEALQAVPSNPPLCFKPSPWWEARCLYGGFVSLPLTCGASDYLTANATEENGEKEQEKRKRASTRSTKEEEKDSTGLSELHLSSSLMQSLQPPASRRPIFIFSTLDLDSLPVLPKIYFLCSSLFSSSSFLPRLSAVIRGVWHLYLQQVSTWEQQTGSEEKGLTCIVFSAIYLIIDIHS